MEGAFGGGTLSLRTAPAPKDDDAVARSPSEGRASAARVGKWLAEKGRSEEAVAVLSAWAASGPNDPEGQQLLAEALRINPGAPLARLAFERMEGLDGFYPPLDEAISRYGAQELARLEQEMNRPAFRRAQVGFNNNVKYKDHVFHIQTEDSGLDKPHVITHLFADGGRVIKSHKRSYADAVSSPDVVTHVRALMKGQQLEMALGLREGRFDEVIAGRAIGGMELLDYPPRVDVQKLATQQKQRVEASPDAPPPSVAPPPMPAPSPSARVHFRLHVLRSLTGGPEVYAPAGDEAIIGSAGAITLPGERFCHECEATIQSRDGHTWLKDFDGGNGVFLRIRAPVALSSGDEIIVGDQLLRVERNPERTDHPGDGPTYFYSSPQWISSFRVLQIFEGGAVGACTVARGTALQIGKTTGDLVIKDPLLSDQHCLVEEQAGDLLLTDLASRTGVFVRIKGEQELVNGDELLVGRTRLLLEKC
jgi:FHA domain